MDRVVTAFGCPCVRREGRLLQRELGGPWSIQNFGWVGPNAFACSLILWKISTIIDIFTYWCHQMSDFKVKMHQIRFLLDLYSRPRWGSLQHSPITFSCTCI